jgi:hypothetical protein
MSKKKHNLKWIKETIDLQPDHHWESKPGYKIFVAGRGAVRLHVPQDWIFEPDTDSFRFLDGAPPNDNCRLEVSYNQLPQGDWNLFPLKPLVQDLIENDSRDVIAKSEIFTHKRQTAQIVWAEIKFMDREEKREAFSRTCVALGSNVQCLITCDYWVEDSDRITPIWDEVLDSLVLGLYIRDPRMGAAFPD